MGELEGDIKFDLAMCSELLGTLLDLLLSMVAQELGSKGI